MYDVIAEHGPELALPEGSFGGGRVLTAAETAAALAGGDD